jgi:hypothetical protein
LVRPNSSQLPVVNMLVDRKVGVQRSSVEENTGKQIEKPRLKLKSYRCRKHR